MSNTVMGSPIAPMLATAGRPPTGDGWAFEIKQDGARCIATLAGGRVRLTSRAGCDVTGSYPELGVFPELCAGRSLILDGELVVCDATGAPRIGLLRHRINAKPTAARLGTYPVVYCVFDVLEIDGEPVHGETYAKRRELLDGLDFEGKSPRVRVPPSYTDVDGLTLLGIAAEHNREGIVAKKLASKYVARVSTGQDGYRSTEWIKTKLDDEQKGTQQR
jgi:bifunctional non-homologous end joining protein LigD